MDLVSIVYQYVNRFINSEELIHLLEKIDKRKFSKEENKEIDKLLEDVKIIVENVPVKIEQVEVNRISNIEHLLESCKKTLDSDNLDKEGRGFLENQYNNMLKDKEKVRDSGPRYEKLFELLTQFPTYTKYRKQMNDLELLEFITQYISVPLPPKITQEGFEDLVSVGIKEDKRESLWRLAVNYNQKEKDFSKIEDYFILKRDDYYLIELISAVEEDLETNKLIEKIIKTNDRDFINNVIKRGIDIGHIFSEEEIEKLKNAIK